MNTSQKTNTLRFLSSINSNHQRFDTKLAILSFHNQVYSPVTEAIILLLEYFQLAAQAFLFNLSVYQTSTTNQHPLLKLLVGASKLVHPGSFLTHEGQDTYEVAVCIVLGLLALKYTLTAYVCSLAFKNRKQRGFWIELWRWIFKFQGRALYLLTTSVLVEVMLAALSLQVEVFGLRRRVIIPVGVVLVCMEYIFSLILHVRFCCIVPTKSILSAKDCILETSTLTQKFVVQLLWLCFSSVPGYAWIIVIFNIIFSLARIAYFFRTLPLYKIKVLSYQGALLSIAFTANLTCLIQVIADSIDQGNIDIYYIIVLWIIISLLAVKIVQGFLNFYILNFAQNSSYTSSKLLLHKAHALKLLIGMRITDSTMYKMNWDELVDAALTSNALEILKLDQQVSVDAFEDMSSKDSVRRLSIRYLEDLMDKFPKSDVIRLYVIYYYAKKLRNFARAMKMINELKPNSSKALLLNASLILYELQNITTFVINSDESKINLSVYLKNVSAVAQWKFHMLQQADLQMSLCEATMEEIPDLAKIYEVAQKMDHYRHTVEKRSHVVFNSIPSHYIEPYMIYAHYQLVVNHSVPDYRTYMRHHYKKYKQYEKIFKSSAMVPENLYQNTGLTIISAQKGTFGKILHCSKGIGDVYGGDVRRYLGSDAGIYAPPITRPYVNLFYKNFVDSNINSEEKAVIRGFGLHKDGYILEVDFFMDMYLFENQGLCLCGINRRVITDKDHMLVTENGEIEGISKNLGRRLGFFNDKKSVIPKINISSISHELARVNEAFNIIALPEKYKPKDAKDTRLSKSKTDNGEQEDVVTNENSFKRQYDMDLEEANQLHYAFSTEGKEIVINGTVAGPFSASEDYSYLCTITAQNYGTMLLKTFTLEEREIDLGHMRQRSSTRKETTKSRVNRNIVETPEKIISSPIDINAKRRKSTDLMNFEDEKQSGWIDLMALESERTPRLLSPLTENRALISLRTQEENPPLSSSRQFLSDRPASKTISTDLISQERQNNLIKQIKQIRSLDYNRSKSAHEEFEEESEVSESDIVKPEQSISSQASKSSHSDATLKAYRTALVSSTTSRPFKILCFCFYALLVTLFGSQLKLKYSLEDFLKTLEVKKNILGHSSFRDTAVASIHGNANALWQTISRVVAGENTAALNASLMTFQASLQEQLGKVDAGNHGLLLDMQYLDEDTRDLFFEKDVRIYDTFFDAPKQVYMNYTHFKAIDRILETGSRALEKSRARDYATAKDDFFFLFRNAENDLLIKSEELGSILDQSITDEREAAQSLTMNYLIATLVFLTVLAVALYVLIWKQYLTERNNLLAFVKLDPQSIQTVHSRLVEFKSKVENEKPFEKTTIDLAEYLQPTMKSKNAKTITVHKKHLQTANYHGIFQKYFLHTLKLTAFIMIFMGLVLWSNISADVSIQFFHKKQAQLRLSGQMKFRTTMAAIILEEILSRNNGSQIMNKWTADISPESLNDIVALRDDITQGFLEDDKQYDPLIADILFSSGRCDLLPNDNKVNCDTLKANGVLLSYISLLTNFEKLLRGRYEKFMSLSVANRTTAAFSAIRSAYGPLFRPMRLTLEYQSDLIFNLINSAFEQDLDTVADTRNTIFSVIVVALVVLSIIAWFSLLRIIKAANNQFKKVLQSLPAHIVLQSFLLRLFLMGNAVTALKDTPDV